MGRKKHHEGHGGAWKVAYADFVTAMMALFMVLWISSQQKEILIATSKYFQNPFTSPMPASSGVMDGKKEKVIVDQNGTPTKVFTADMYMALAKEFLKMLDLHDSSKKKALEIKVTGEGILITLFNKGNQPLFENGSSNLTEWGKYTAQNLSWIIDQYHMRVKIDAHAPENAQLAQKETDAWDLTSEQANIMRRELVKYGLDVSKIDRVSGFGDSHPQQDRPADDLSNYRLELTLSATPETPRNNLK